MIIRAGIALWQKALHTDSDGINYFVEPIQGSVETELIPLTPDEDAQIAAKITDMVAQDAIKVIKDKKKVAINDAIDGLSVEVDGLVFRANDKSISRMRSALDANADFKAMSHTEVKRRLGLPDGFDVGKLLATIDWKMADETFMTITLTQLRVAHAKAILAIGSILAANA